MKEKSVMEVTIKERENEMPGKPVRVVGMCFYGHGLALNIDCMYTLGHNPTNPKDES